MASIVDNFNKQFRSEDLTRAQYAKEKFLADLFRELVSRVKIELIRLDSQGFVLNAQALANRFRLKCFSTINTPEYHDLYYFLGIVREYDRFIELWTRRMLEKYANSLNLPEHIDSWRIDQLFKDHDAYLLQNVNQLALKDQKIQEIKKSLTDEEVLHQKEIENQAQLDAYHQKLHDADPQTLQAYTFQNLPFEILPEGHEIPVLNQFKGFMKSKLSDLEKKGQFNDFVTEAQLYYDILDVIFRKFPASYLSLKLELRKEDQDLFIWMETFRRGHRDLKIQPSSQLDQIQKDLDHYFIFHEQAQLVYHYQLTQVKKQELLAAENKKTQLAQAHAEKEIAKAKARMEKDLIASQRRTEKEAEKQKAKQAKAEIEALKQKEKEVERQERLQEKVRIEAEQAKRKAEVESAKAQAKADAESQKAQEKAKIEAEKVEKAEKARIETEKAKTKEVQRQKELEAEKLRIESEKLKTTETKKLEAEKAEKARVEAEKAKAKDLQRQKELNAEKVKVQEKAKLEAEKAEKVRVEAEKAKAKEVQRQKELDAEKIKAQEKAKLDAEKAEIARIEAEKAKAKEIQHQKELEAEKIKAQEKAKLDAEKAEKARVEAEKLKAQEKAKADAQAVKLKEVKSSPAPVTSPPIVTKGAAVSTGEVAKDDFAASLSDRERAELERARLRQENDAKKAEMEAAVKKLSENFRATKKAIEEDTTLSADEKNRRLIALAKKRTEDEINILTQKADGIEKPKSEEELEAEESVKLNEERQRMLEEQAKKPRLKAMSSSELEQIWEFYFLHRYNHPTPEEFYGGPKAKEIVKRMLQQINTIYDKINPSKAYIEKLPGKSKLYYVGDLRGSFKDLDQMARFFQGKIFEAQATDTPLRIIFMGNFIGNTPMDFHTMMYLIIFNLLYPHEVLLLRGNHEERSISGTYQFSTTITKQFGTEILDEFNAFFAKLPLVHFVDSVHKNIFCVHGGIPVNQEDPNKILAFRRLTFRSFKENINDMDTTAQQFLYNNPGLELARGKLVQAIPNTPGFEFGKRIFSDFMRKNKVDLFIRGNQIIPEGYGLYWNNKLLSLCSTSEYEKKLIPAKIVEILFPADPEYPEEGADGAEGEAVGDEEGEEGEGSVEDVDEVVDEFAEAEEMEIGQGDAPPVEEIKETAIRLLDVENLHS